MAIVVVGMFDAESQAAEAVHKLLRSCVPSGHVRTLVPRRHQLSIASKRRSGRRSSDRRGGEQRSEQPGGILVAVNAADNVSKFLAVNVLRKHGARDIEHTAAGHQAPPQKESGTGVPSVQYPLQL